MFGSKDKEENFIRKERGLPSRMRKDYCCVSTFQFFVRFSCLLYVYILNGPKRRCNVGISPQFLEKLENPVGAVQRNTVQRGSLKYYTQKKSRRQIEIEYLNEECRIFSDQDWWNN